MRHRNCLEGMAAGPAIEDRWGAKGKDLASNDAVWKLEAYYIVPASLNDDQGILGCIKLAADALRE